LAGCRKSMTLQQLACEGTDLYIGCGERLIRVQDANYGRLDNSFCTAPRLGTPNDNCRFDATCIARKWSVSLSDVNETKFFRPRPIFWSETGLVMKPTVSDHITVSVNRSTAGSLADTRLD